MSNIIIAGAGVGGLFVAEKLSREGHSVTVFEKSLPESMGYDQTDFVDEKYFTFAGLEIPEGSIKPKNEITLVPLDKSVEPITLPAGNDNSLFLNRKELFENLKERCDKAGVVFEFGCEIFEPIVLGSRVVGIKASKGDFFADLIIDSCGVSSPLRQALPEFTHIQREFGAFDKLYTYRAYFNKNKEMPDPETNYNIFVKHNGDEGISWLVNDGDFTDVLIARFNKLSDSQILEELMTLCKENPHMGTTLVRGGEKSVIPVRQPLSVFVCDGYAAIGDSACMTYPIKGSGIGYSLVAAKLLSDCVNSDTDGLFIAETLWPYEVSFFKEVGFEACRLALMKNLLPYVTAKEVSDLLGEKILTTDEIRDVYNDITGTLISSKAISAIREKLKKLSDYPDSRAKLLELIKWYGKWLITEPQFPMEYNRQEVAKWAEKYDEFFESIKRSEEIELF